MISDRDTQLLARLRRALARYEAKPAPRRENYAADRDYKRAVTIRQHGLNILRRKIKTLEAGRPYADWIYVQLEENA